MTPSTLIAVSTSKVVSSLFKLKAKEQMCNHAEQSYKPPHTKNAQADKKPRENTQKIIRTSETNYQHAMFLSLHSPQYPACSQTTETPFTNSHPCSNVRKYRTSSSTDSTLSSQRASVSLAAARHTPAHVLR